MNQTKHTSDCSDSAKNCASTKATKDVNNKAYGEHDAKKPIGDCDCPNCDCPSDGNGGKQDDNKQRPGKKYKCKNCGTIHNCGTPPKSCCKCDCTDFKEI